MSAAQQEALVKLSNEFQKIQEELGTLVTSRQKLEAQENENVAVSREFGRLGANDKVYKLIGPALMLQEQDEAKGNVQKRLELIKSELRRTDDLIKSSEGKLEGKKMEIVKLQTAAAAAAGAA